MQAEWIVPTRKEYRRLTPEMKETVIRFVRDHGRYVGLMAKCVGVCRETMTQHIKNDPDFKAAIDDVLEERSAELEREARRRAIEGVTRKKYDKEGKLIEEEQVYSDRLMERLLEADIEKFKSKSPFGPGSGVVGGVLLIPMVAPEKAMSVEDLSARLERLSAVQHDLEITEGGTRDPGKSSE